MGYFDNILDRVERKVNSVIDSAKNTAKSAVKAVVNSIIGEDETPAKKNAQVSILNPDNHLVEEVGDKLSIKQNKPQITSKPTETSNKKDDNVAKKQNAKNEVSKKTEKLVRMGVLTQEQINTELKDLSVSEQLVKLSEIENVVNQLEKDQRKGYITEDVKQDMYVRESLHNIKEAKENGVIKTDKEAQKFHYIEKMKNSLGRDFDSLSQEDKIKRIELVKGVFIKEFETDLYKKASAAERKTLDAYKQKRIAFLEKQLQLAYLAVINGNARESVRFRNGHDIADAKNTAISLKINPTEVADSMTADWDMQLLQYYETLGQMPTAKEHGQGVQVATSYMSNEGIVAYEARANEIKQDFYNGDSQYSFLSEEYFTETTVAIGTGALLNRNMTVQEKATFLKTWNEHAQQYSDYDEVREKFYNKIQELQDKNPDFKNTIDNVKVLYNKKYGSNPELPRAALKRYSCDNVETKPDSQIDAPQKKGDILENDNKNISNEIVVKKQILSGELTSDASIKKALGIKSDYKLAVFYAKDPMLRVLHKESIRTYIINEDVNSGNLQALAEKAPAIIDLIMNNMRGDKQKFVADLISQHKVGYDTTKHIKKEVEDAA